MKSSIKERCFVIADLKWLIQNPTTQPTAGLTAFRQECGISDLFSVYVRFWMSDSCAGAWNRAKIFALAEEMESRLPPCGNTLVITAGEIPVAEARIISQGVESI